VRSIDGEVATLEVTQDFRSERHAVWGITARNREQNLALNLLLDPDIDFVTILGPAGTGKTLLTLAAGLAQTLDTNRFSEIIMTRDDPARRGHRLPAGNRGREESPGWALMVNLEVLTQAEGGSGGRGDPDAAPPHQIRSLNFMRGRTFLNR
jgi:PhoH-like ATPase